MNVLIVEDHEINRKLLRVSLESEGLTVYQAADGVDALAMLERAPVTIDAVISDILMPRMDGYQLCHELRASEHFASLPFIMYTATYLSPGDERMALDMGADAFLRKPATTAVLMAALRKAAESRARRGPARPSPKPGTERLKPYSERLVAKLEDTSVELQHRSEELRVAHEQLQRLLTHSPAVLYTLRVQGQHIEPTFVSDNIRRLSGLSPAECARFEWWQTSLHPDDRERALATRTRGLAEGGYSMEYRIRHEDGSYRWVEDQNRVLHDAAGQPVEAFGVWTDITDRKRAREAIERFADLVASSSDAIIGTTLDSVVTSWNPAAEALLGYSGAEVIGRPFTVLIPPERLDDERIILDRIPDGGRIVDLETRRVRKDGRQIDVSVTISPVRDSNDRIVGASQITRDITPRKEAEQLRAAISVSLSHELNTPLNGIVGVAEMIESDLDSLPASELREMVTMIRSSAKRLQWQVTRNLDFAQIELLSTTPPPAGGLEATVAVQRVAAKLSREHGRVADLVVDVTAGTVAAAPPWVDRLVSELLDNAFKFSKVGTPVCVMGRFEAGRFSLSVRDAGRGMTGEQIAAVGAFVQFDRHRFAQEGVGLGLYLARRITEWHGGDLSLASVPGKGTTAVATLPSA